MNNGTRDNFKITIAITIFPYITLMFIYRPNFFAHNYFKHIITDFATSCMKTNNDRFFALEKILHDSCRNDQKATLNGEMI